MAHSTCVLPDGAVLAYEVLGSPHLGNALPLVLVCGMASTRADWVRLSATWAQTRPGIKLSLPFGVPPLNKTLQCWYTITGKNLGSFRCRSL